MKKKKDLRSQLPMADMHTNGVRFDPEVLEALRRQRAGNSVSLSPEAQGD